MSSRTVSNKNINTCGEIDLTRKYKTLKPIEIKTLELQNGFS